MDQKYKDFGRIGERLVLEWLKDAGYFVVPASLIDNGGAPLLEGLIESYILPDLLASLNGKTRWIDVKSKDSCTLSSKRQRWETGCELRHWNNYLAVQQATHIKGAVAFVHKEENQLYLGDLDTIGETMAIWPWTPEWGKLHPHHPFKESMVLFHRDCFDWYDLGDGKHVHEFRQAAVERTTVRPWEKRKPPQHKQSDLFIDWTKRNKDEG